MVAKGAVSLVLLWVITQVLSRYLTDHQVTGVMALVVVPLFVLALALSEDIEAWWRRRRGAAVSAGSLSESPVDATAHAMPATTFSLAPPTSSSATTVGLKGEISFTAHIAGQYITFPKVTAKVPWPNVEAIELESAHENAEEVTGTVRVTGVASEDEGMDVATAAMEDALSRLVYGHGVSIEPAQVTGSRFEPVVPPLGPNLQVNLGTGYMRITAGSLRAIRSIEPASIQATLEAAAPAGEGHYSLYRSARGSSTQFEEFMHLYSMLLQLVGDKQDRVDAFIKTVEPSVAQSISPKDGKTFETVYTRLRNEVGHRRAGTTVQRTRAEMVANVAGLREIVRAAIKAFP